MCVSDRCQFGAKADGHRHFDPELPFGVITTEKNVPSRGVGLGSTIAQKIFTKTEPAVVTHQIDSGEEVIFCGNDLQFSLFDSPFLFSQFHIAFECFAKNILPIKGYLGHCRIVRWANQSAIGCRDSHQESQAVFSGKNITLGLFGLGSEGKVLFASECFALFAAAHGTPKRDRLYGLPGFQ